MRIGLFVLRNVVRNAARTPVRSLVTVLTVAIMIVGFIFPRAVVDAQEARLRATPNDRVVISPKRGWGWPMPANYTEIIRQMPGVKEATGNAAAALKLPGKDDVFFGSGAVDPGPFIAMHHEVVAPPEQKQAFLDNERGAMVARDLAEKMGWKLGDRLVFESRRYPGQWEVEVVAIHESTRDGFAENNVWIGWSYFNRVLPKEQRETITFIGAQIHEPNQGGRIAKAIDAHFFTEQVPTRSQEDHVLAAARIAQVSAILTGLEIVSYLILLVVAAIFGNTLAMGVRERTREFGVLRAIGFAPPHLGLLVLGDAVLLGLAGAGTGLALSYPLVEGLLARALQDVLRFFPPLVIPHDTALFAALTGMGLALLAAAIPAYRAMRLAVIESLARVA